jgi:hypothetical protein
MWRAGQHANLYVQLDDYGKARRSGEARVRGGYCETVERRNVEAEPPSCAVACGVEFYWSAYMRRAAEDSISLGLVAGCGAFLFCVHAAGGWHVAGRELNISKYLWVLWLAVELS